jgi:hypothetical protein
MSQGQGGPWKGRGTSEGDDASLQKAIEAAWKDAKGKDAPAGTYLVKTITIETVNPIRGYTVDIESI